VICPAGETCCFRMETGSRAGYLPGTWGSRRVAGHLRMSFTGIGHTGRTLGHRVLGTEAGCPDWEHEHQPSHCSGLATWPPLLGGTTPARERDTPC